VDVAELIEVAQARRRLPEPRERRLIRELAGVSRLELAGVVGVDAATLWRWETGRHRPRGVALVR
jgi:DNA-binding transcriptional regulator YiaG